MAAKRKAKRSAKRGARKAPKRAAARGAYTLVHRNRALATYPTLAKAEDAKAASGMRPGSLRIIKD